VTGRMLIAGVGNIFLGDDGFGVEVIMRLSNESLPDWVRVADYGISGMHLAYDLAEGFETTVLVDATPRGGEPGTLYVMELEPGSGIGADTSTPLAAPDTSIPLAAPDTSTPLVAPDTSTSPAAVPSAESRGIPLLDGHGMQPDVVFGMLKMLGTDAGRVLLVGCEPASIDEGIGLSAPVTAAVDEAVRILLDLVRAEVGTGAESVEAASQTAQAASQTAQAASRTAQAGSRAAQAGSRPGRTESRPTLAGNQTAQESSRPGLTGSRPTLAGSRPLAAAG
jgi:hydrogenase maturation protease